MMINRYNYNLKMLTGFLLLGLLSFNSACNSDRSNTALTDATDTLEGKPDGAGQTAEPVLSEAEKDSLRLQAQEMAQQFIIVDGHVDLPYRLRNKQADVSTRTEEGDFDYERAKAGGLDAPFMSIYIPASYENSQEARVSAVQQIELVERLANKHPQKFALAFSPADIRQNTQKGLISLPMGMENGAPILGKLENLDYFHKRGIRYITLAHSESNHISDSSYDPERRWGGLSPFGRQVVQRMNELGIMVDVSHISDSAFYQVLRLSKAPVIASHSSARHFTPAFERNMSDEMIRALGKKGGVIMINFGSAFISEASRKLWDQSKAVAQQWRQEQGLAEGDPAVEQYRETYFREQGGHTSVQAVAAHIDHVARLAGVEHVGLGSDFEGVGDTLPEGLKDVSQYPNLFFELLKMGYSREDIEKITHANVFRVWEEVERVAGG